ncbi:MAG: hypothetical protein K1060chlam2_01027 [Chlamydiae bacterium]|nr:hypothetical protein [Chlamydiota bacterium]
MHRQSKKIVVLILSACLLVLAGCSTQYGSEGFIGGGFSETLMAADTYIVTFKGNGFTSYEKAIKYALRRASELTLENGYKYFSINSSMDHSKQVAYSNASANSSGQIDVYRCYNSVLGQYKGSGSRSSYSGIITKPRVSIGIKCYREKPKDIEVIDARFFLASN